jgi:Ca2+-binding RTX toxin-like protein
MADLLDTAPLLPAAPVISGVRSAVGSVQGNMDAAALDDVFGVVTQLTSTDFRFEAPGALFAFSGTGLTYDLNGVLTGGTIGAMTLNLARGPFAMQIALSPSVTRTTDALGGDSAQVLIRQAFSAADAVDGGTAADLIRGYGGADLIAGGGGADSLFGGQGDDVIYGYAAPGVVSTAAPGPTYLRGDEGADYVLGGPAFDDINGNMGDDTAAGGAGDDWVVGGKDQDLLFGDAGDDLVYGNLGNDTCAGGDGADVVRGGQGNDVLYGGAGADFVSGDRGDDTISGGAGADVFHGSQDAGLDRVTDFSAAEGDRVQLDPGTTYAVSQVGADTVIDMGAGHRMVLVGVQLSSLPPGWIFGA